MINNRAQEGPMLKKNLRAMQLLPALLALSACGFTGNLRGSSGFASFRTPSTMIETDRQFALSLGPIPLRLATMISRPILDEDDEWISDVLSNVRAVRVYVYEIEGKTDRVIEHLDTTRGALILDGWEQLAAIREDGGLVTALVMHDKPALVSGIVVMYEEDEQLVLVNLIGDIEPATFGLIMDALDIGVPLIEIEEPAPQTADI
jgi:hypothetical protein